MNIYTSLSCCSNLYYQRTLRIIVSSICTTLLFGCGPSTSNDDTAPVAKISIIGAPAINGEYSLRSGSDILITGKDSDGLDDPILDYAFVAVSINGEDLGLETINNALIERTRNTKLFKIPKVSTPTQIEFELTVTDADNISAQDTLTVNIQPIKDANVFLSQKAVQSPNFNNYTLVVALDLDEDEVSVEDDYTVQIDDFVEWEPAAPHPSCNFGSNQNLCQLQLKSQTLSGSWQAGLTRTDTDLTTAATAYFNPTHLIAIPAIDIDAINSEFETGPNCVATELRCKRFELQRIDSARTFQRFSFVSTNNNARLIIRESGSDDQTNDDHWDSGLLWLNTHDEIAAQDVNAEAIRRSKVIESLSTANTYYRLIDPDNNATTLSRWLSLRGFNSSATDTSDPSFAHATYINNYDLGFGRDMFMRRDDCGNVYSYVENFPSLELAIQGRNNFATVVMEYSALDTTKSCAEQSDKIVKFYAYVPDQNTGEQQRVGSMNFDGRGEKFVPGVCTACHAGSPYTEVQLGTESTGTNLVEFSGRFTSLDERDTTINNLSDADRLALADINSTFMPFDMDAYLYTRAEDQRFVDPSLNESLLVGVDPADYSREQQAEQFRRFNQHTLFTFIDARARYLANQPDTSEPTVDDTRLDEATRWDAPIALINSWYQSDVDNQSFNGNNLLPGWEDAPDLYHQVFAKYCRACHIQLAELPLNFSHLDEFIGAVGDDGTPNNIINLADKILTRGQMPIARLTYDRFWTDFNGESQSAGTTLTNYIADFVPEISDETGPMQSLSPFDIRVKESNRNDIGSEVNADGSINGEGQTISFDASQLFNFLQSPSWTIENNCESAAFLHAKTSSIATLISDISPCRYAISLHSNDDIQTQILVVDKKPRAKLIAYSTATMPEENFDPIASYTPGDAYITLDILRHSQFIADDFGDSELSTIELVVNQPEAPYNLTETNWVSKSEDNKLLIALPERLPSATSTLSFDYQLQDASAIDDASISEVAGRVDLEFSAIELRLSTQQLTDASIAMQWASNPLGIKPSSINIYKSLGSDNGELFEAVLNEMVLPEVSLENCHNESFAENTCDGDLSALSYSDTDVTTGNNYSYLIEAIFFDGDIADNNVRLLSNTLTETVVSKPVLQISSAATTPTQLTIEWQQPAGLEQANYILRRCDRSADFSCVPTEIVVSASCEQSADCDGASPENWSIVDSGLTPNNRYGYSVEAISTSANTLSNTQVGVSYPSAPNNINVSVSDTQINLSWSHNDNNTVGVSYQVFRVAGGTCLNSTLTSSTGASNLSVSPSCPDAMNLQIRARGLDNQFSVSRDINNVRRYVSLGDLNNLVVPSLGCGGAGCHSDNAPFESSSEANCSLPNNTTINCAIMGSKTITPLLHDYFLRWENENSITP